MRSWENCSKWPDQMMFSYPSNPNHSVTRSRIKMQHQKKKNTPNPNCCCPMRFRSYLQIESHNNNYGSAAAVKISYFLLRESTCIYTDFYFILFFFTLHTYALLADLDISSFLIQTPAKSWKL